jgi:uncharacterized CHY-type Zn-finger protein
MRCLIASTTESKSSKQTANSSSIMLPDRRRSCEYITYHCTITVPYCANPIRGKCWSFPNNLPKLTFREHANKHECIPGTDQERFALPVRASVHSSYAKRSKAHLTEQKISGVRFRECDKYFGSANDNESTIMREGLAP